MTIAYGVYMVAADLDKSRHIPHKDAKSSQFNISINGLKWQCLDVLF